MSPLVDSFLDQTTEALSNFELRPWGGGVRS